MLGTPVRFVLLAGPALLATLLTLVLPSDLLAGQEGAVDGTLLSLGFSPLLSAVAWLLWRSGQRDEKSFAKRIEALEAKLSDVQRDLDQTEERMAAARRDAKRFVGTRSEAAIDRELAQDERLRTAQRRLVVELTARVEQLRIARWRAELAYAEACRDARLPIPEVAAELETRIECLRQTLDGSEIEAEAWIDTLEEAYALHRDLTRGIPRLHAAARLDPLSHAGMGAESLLEDDDEREELGGALDEDTELQLERIDRSFDALEELADEMAGDADSSGVRVRVDDEVMATLDGKELDAADEVEVAGGEERISSVEL